MTASWYYATAEGAKGPVGEAALFDLIRTGTIQKQTLLWTEGMPEWLPAQQLAVYDQAHQEEEAPPPPPVFQQQPRATLRPSPPDPWRRFAARSLDFFIFQFLMTPLIGEIDPTQAHEVAKTLVGLYLGWAVIEGILLATLGATPGKWLLRIEVSDAFGRRLSLVASFRRAFDVAVRGMGLGLPYLHVFAQLFGLYQLTGRGITPWDRAGSCVVKHAPLELSRWLVFLFLVLWIAQSGNGIFGAR